MKTTDRVCPVRKWRVANGNRNSIGAYGLIATILLLCTSTVWGQDSRPLRRWSDASGKFEVQATLIKVERDSVQLSTADGKVVTVKISQLSDADRAFIKRMNAIDLNDPTPSANVKLDGNPIRIMAYHTGRKLDLDVPDTWQVAPDPAPAWAMAFPEFSFEIATLNIAYAFLQAPYSPHAISISPEKTHLVAQAFDLSQPELSFGPRFQLPLQKPFCLSPSGQRLVMLEVWLSESNRLWLHELAGDSVRPQLTWAAFDRVGMRASPRNEQFTLKSARFADERYLVTMHRGLCALWDLDAGELRWWTYTDYPIESSPNAAGASGIAVSPGGHQVFFQCDGNLVGVSIPDGRVIAKKKLNSRAAPELSISPDGRNLILMSQMLRVVSLESGSREVDIGINRLAGGDIGTLQPNRIPWVTNRMLLVDTGFKSTLVDLNRKGELRTYVSKKQPESQQAFFLDGNGGVAYAANEGSIKENTAQAGLYRLDLSKDIARSESGDRLNYDMQPGDSVGLSLQLVENQVDGKKVDWSKDFHPTIEQLLIDRGFHVRADSANRFQLNWTISTQTVNWSEGVQRNGAPSPTVNRSDNVTPFTGSSRPITPLEGGFDDLFRMTRSISTRNNLQTSDCGIMVGGKLVFITGSFQSNCPVALSISDQMAYLVRDLEIPDFVRVDRANYVELGVRTQTEKPNSNPLSSSGTGPPTRPRSP